MSGHAGNGGIQRHSLGEDYPWTVVGTIDEAGDTRYYVQNLITGETYAKGWPLHSCSIAHATAHLLKVIHYGS